MTLQRPQSGASIPRGWFGRLYDEIVACRVRGDGRTIAAVRTPSGTVLSAIRTSRAGGQGASDDYKGQFKVGMTGGGLYIYDGANETSDTAGVIFAGSRAQEFPKTELTTIDGDIYVILEYITTSPFWLTHIHQGGVAESPYADNPRAAHFLVATYNGGLITQQHTTGAIYVTGRWLA